MLAIALWSPCGCQSEVLPLGFGLSLLGGKMGAWVRNKHPTLIKSRQDNLSATINDVVDNSRGDGREDVAAVNVIPSHTDRWRI